jgi:uncharacterized protein
MACGHFSDISFVAGGKERGLCRLRRTILMYPLLTEDVHAKLIDASRRGSLTLECSLDLNRSLATVELSRDGWVHKDRRYPYLEACKPRTIYYWTGASFEPLARFGAALIKLVPTEWGPPTFEIDGVKMLPTARLSPYEDARAKVGLIRPAGKVILDTCGGLGYFAAHCLAGGAAGVLSFEKSADVMWLRTLNPWSPGEDERLTLQHGDIAEQIETLSAGSVSAVLHDPPRFGLAGELYSQKFYDQLFRVLGRRGILFHYTGTPNKLTSGRDVPNEVATRLRRSGFNTKLEGDGVLGFKP